jgi:hypothetical protein
LTNPQELDVTKLDWCNPTLRPTDINSNITNSGLSGYYFTPGAPVNNYDATTPTIEVWVAYVPPVQCIASGKLALVPALPVSSQKGHDKDGFPHSLIGLSPFVGVGYCVLFTKTLVIAFDQDDKAILIGDYRPKALALAPPPTAANIYQLAHETAATRALHAWHQTECHPHIAIHHHLCSQLPHDTAAATHAPFCMLCSSRAPEQ